MAEMLGPLIQRFEDSPLSEAHVIPWGCPVPVFGHLATSHVATVGLNPSSREFVDGFGNELDGPDRRFETLNSLGLVRWGDASANHLQRIWSACQNYFSKNPYDTWFKKLDRVISDTRWSYYCGTASHLDLIPYATACKWSSLSPHQRAVLLLASGDTLGLLLRQSRIRILVLNGASVVALFERLSGAKLQQKLIPRWSLRRGTHSAVVGYAYIGHIRSFGGVRLDRPLSVLGYNHNIQSSFGVTREVTAAIRRWIGRMSKEALC